MTLKASCTWGDGPDVLVVLDNDGKGDVFMPYEAPFHPEPPRGDPKHGYIRKGSICLTATDAEVLAAQLMDAAKQAHILDSEYAKHTALDMQRRAVNEVEEEKEVRERRMKLANLVNPFLNKPKMEWKNVPPDKSEGVTKEEKEALTKSHPTKSHWPCCLSGDLFCRGCPERKKCRHSVCG